jgi:thiol:disulfide interchange protein DsbD
MSVRQLFGIALVGIGVLVAVQAQQPRQRPFAKLTTLTATTATPQGREVRLVVRAVLPATDLHVQSNTPREEGLIPTVLTIDPPAGVTIEELVYPTATEFAVAGFDKPLLVYGHDFVIGVRATVASTATPGTVTIPARLRYQACDDLLCYTPITVETTMAVTVVAAGARSTPQHQDIFKTIPFGKGIKPPARTDAAPAVVAAAVDPSGDGIAALDAFDVRSPAGGYMNRDEFLEFIANAEAGITPSGWFEGRGPLAILAIVLLGGLALNLTPCVLPMIPINLAIIGAGARA